MDTHLLSYKVVKKLYKFQSALVHVEFKLLIHFFKCAFVNDSFIMNPALQT